MAGLGRGPRFPGEECLEIGRGPATGGPERKLLLRAWRTREERFFLAAGDFVKGPARIRRARTRNRARANPLAHSEKERETAIGTEIWPRRCCCNAFNVGGRTTDGWKMVTYRLSCTLVSFVLEIVYSVFFFFSFCFDWPSVAAFSRLELALKFLNSQRWQIFDAFFNSPFSLFAVFRAGLGFVH